MTSDLHMRASVCAHIHTHTHAQASAYTMHIPHKHTCMPYCTVPHTRRSTRIKHILFRNVRTPELCCLLHICRPDYCKACFNWFPAHPAEATEIRETNWKQMNWEAVSAKTWPLSTASAPSWTHASAHICLRTLHTHVHREKSSFYCVEISFYLTVAPSLLATCPAVAESGDSWVQKGRHGEADVPVQMFPVHNTLPTRQRQMETVIPNVDNSRH